MSVSISREKTVFYAALDVADPAQRRQFLDQACASDAELRMAVRACWLPTLTPGNSLTTALSA